MLAQIIAIVMMATALLGGGGAAAVYASQESLPGETLYPLKTWSEDMRIGISTDAETDLQLNLQFAERRMAEIAAMAGHDDDHAAQAVLRLQNHLNQALEATGQVSQEQALPAMQRVRQTLQTQQSLMQQLMGNPDPAATPVMTQSRQMFQQQLHVMENQLVEEQEQLQIQLQNQQQIWAAGTARPAEPDPAAGACRSPGAQPDAEPGSKPDQPSGCGPADEPEAPAHHTYTWSYPGCLATAAGQGPGIWAGCPGDSTSPVKGCFAARIPCGQNASQPVKITPKQPTNQKGNKEC